MPRRALSVLCLLGALALVTGCAGAKSTASSIPESASLAPADALAYATVTTDEGSDQWKNAESLLARVPGAKDGVSGSVGSALGEQGVDWKNDVRPAIGPELVVVATADQQPIVLVQPSDEAKLEALLAKSDTTYIRAEVDGWEALAQSQAALDAYRASLDKGTLDDVDAFSQGFESLPSDALARVWVDTARLSKDLGRLVEQASTEVDLGLDWLAAAVAAEEDGVLLTLGMRMPGGGDTRYEPELFDRVPADAVAAVSFGGTQKLLDRVQGNVDLDNVSGQIESLTGVSLKGLTDALSGEGALYVRPSGEQVPEVTLVLRPPDPSKTWETVDGLARKLAEQAKTTITVRTQDGTEVHRVATDQATISYARIGDDTIVATTGANGIRTFLADGPKLVDSDAYKRAADAVDMGEKTRGFVYVDVDGVLPLAEQAGESLPPDAKDTVAAIDSFILQASGEGDVTKVSGFVRLND
ncbi:MAG TPA: DUF3352 domain-containing protein [Gaiella sp.]